MYGVYHYPGVIRRTRPQGPGGYWEPIESIDDMEEGPSIRYMWVDTGETRAPTEYQVPRKTELRYRNSEELPEIQPERTPVRGAFGETYDTAMAEAEMPSNPWPGRVAMYGLATCALPAKLIESPAVSVLNWTYGAEVAGQNLGKAILTNDPAVRRKSILEAVVHIVGPLVEILPIRWLRGKSQPRNVGGTVVDETSNVASGNTAMEMGIGPATSTGPLGDVSLGSGPVRLYGPYHHLINPRKGGLYNIVEEGLLRASDARPGVSSGAWESRAFIGPLPPPTSNRQAFEFYTHPPPECPNSSF